MTINGCRLFFILGENQLPNHPGLTRGLVSVLLFFDGQRCLVAALRALAQARDGRTWTVGISQELQAMISAFIEDLLQEDIVTTILGKVLLVLQFGFSILLQSQHYLVKHPFVLSIVF